MQHLLEQQLQRIGRDLHDSVGQLMAGVAMLADLISEQLGQEQHALAPKAEWLARHAAEAQHQIGYVYYGLAPPELGAQGLPSALRRLAEATTIACGVSCCFDEGESADPLSETQAVHLFRIAQEAVRNAVRHAAPSAIRLALHREGPCLTLRVEDDGIGFDPATCAGNGLGLRSIYHRAALLDAACTIEPRTPRGTVLAVRLQHGTWP
jgi:signal transduction histidine kinase